MTDHVSTRRTFLAKASASLLTGALCSCSAKDQQQTPAEQCADPRKKHIVTLSFDDGFEKSSIRTAQIYEKYDLSACINVIATGHLDSFEPPGKWIAASKKGDFSLWNDLQDRGHEIMPHSYKHANLTRMDFQQAKQLILRCLDYFEKNLKNFDRTSAVFNFPYNQTTPALEDWIITQTRAFRTHGGFINPLPHKGQVKLLTGGFGPGNCEHDLDSKINDLLRTPQGWLIYNLHGLDGQGWGPISSAYLENLLDKLVATDTVTVMPAARALNTLAL